MYYVGRVRASGLGVRGEEDLRSELANKGLGDVVGVLRLTDFW